MSARAEAALGRLAFDEGDHDAAIELLERALGSPICRSSERMAALESLGKALALLARFDESRAVFDEGWQQLGKRTIELAELRFSVLLANLLIDRGNPERAEELLSTIIDDARKTRDPLALANLYWSQARLHALTAPARPRRALCAHGSRNARGDRAHRRSRHAPSAMLAHIENDRGNHAEALAFADEGAPVLAAAGNRFEEGIVLLEKARALGALDQPRRGDRDRARRHPAVRARASDERRTRVRSRRRDLQGSRRERARALELYELAVETSPTEDRHLGDMYRAIGEIHEAEGRPGEALEYFKRALDVQTRVPR